MGQSQHNTLRNMTETIAQQFRDAGHTADVYDLLSSTSVDQLEAKFRDRAFDLMVAFQGWGLNFFDEGPNLFDRAQVPYITILGDHPMYHASRLKHLSSRNAVLLLDADHVSFVQGLASCPVVAGPFALKDTADYGPRVPLSARDVPLLFMGSCGDPAAMRAELGKHPAVLRSILLETLEIKTESAPIRTTDALGNALAARGIDHKLVPVLRRATMMESVDRIARAERRLRIIRGIRETPLTIWGPGWPDDIGAKRNVTLVPKGFPTGAAAAKRARVLLNIFQDEFAIFHDRCALAMCTWTPVLSDRTPAFVESYETLGRAFCYSDGPDIDSVLTVRLHDDGWLDSIATEGHASVEAAPDSASVNCILKAFRALLDTL